MIPTQISESELSKTLVARLPLRPAAESKYRTAPMTGEEIRDAFDASARLISTRLNRLIEFLTDTSTGSGVAELPYSAAMTLGQTLEKLGDMLENLESELQTLEEEHTRSLAELEVKSYGDLKALDLKTEQKIMEVESAVNEVKRLTANINEAAEAAKEAALSSESIMQEMQVALKETQDDLEDNAAANEQTQLEVANLSSVMQVLQNLQEQTAALAGNAVQQVNEQGLYAHDFDSKTGKLVERLMLYTPTASATFKGSWRIAQRDIDGCLQAQPPKNDYQLTPKFYVEENFRRRTEAGEIKVKGRFDVDTWQTGVIYEYGKGGDETANSSMQSSNADGLFLEGEEVIFYCDCDGAFITDIFHAQEPLVYDTETGLYKLIYRQRAFTREDTYLCSCRINAPIGARFFYDCRDYDDKDLYTLEAAHDYTLSGCGKKTLQLSLPENYYAHDGNEVSVRFSSNAIQVFFESAVPIYFYGDRCENGKLKNIFGLRYHLTFSFDGVGFVCRVLAYPLPVEDEVEE